MTLRQRKVVEDISNTWNQQLMAACLTGNLQEAQRVVDCGADALRARESTAFSHGCRLSPLVAVLLSLVSTNAIDRLLTNEEAKNELDVVEYLMSKGATFNDLIELPSTPALFNDPIRHNRLNWEQKKVDPDYAKQQSSHGSLSGAGAHRRSLRSAGMELKDTLTSSDNVPSRKVRVYGTILHYLILLRDHVSLFRLLYFIGATPLTPSLSGSNTSNKLASSMEVATSVEMGPIFPFSLLNELQQELEGKCIYDAEEDYITQPSQNKCSNNLRLRPGSRPTSGSGRARQPRLSKASSMSSILMRTQAVRSDTGNDRALWNPFLTLLPHPEFPTLASLFRRVDMSRTPHNDDGCETFCSASLLDFSMKLTTDIPFEFMPERTKMNYKAQMLNTTENSMSTQHREMHDAVFILSRSALELACALGDTMSIRLLSFYGAGELNHKTSSVASGKEPAQMILIDHSQTELARACSTGDLPRVEALLDAGVPHGASVTQISEDGRYTLIHYSVGHRPVLDYLVQRRGLKIDIENAFGESALISLIRYGTGRNPSNACRDAPCANDVSKLASLPRCVVQNYILTPLSLSPALSQQPRLSTVPMTATNTRGGSHSTAVVRQARASPSGTVSPTGNAALHRGDRSRSVLLPNSPANAFGAGEVERMWNFTDRPTVELIQNVIDYGANIHGHIPESEHPLRYVEYGLQIEEKGRQGAGSETTINTAALSLSKERDGVGIGVPRQSQRSTAKAGGNVGENNASNSNKATKNVSTSDSRNFASAITSDISHKSKAPPVNLSAELSFEPGVSWPERIPRSGPGFDDNHLIFLEEKGGHEKSSRDTLGTVSRETTTCTPLKDGDAIGQRNSHSTSSSIPARMPLRATPLMHAIFNYHPELIRKFIVEYKVDLMRRDSQGASVLHYAAAWCPPGETSILELLTSSLASAIQSTNNGAVLDINTVDMAGRTPLYYAAAVGNVDTMKWLLQLGSTVHAGRPDKHGLTPLHVAVLKNHPMAVAVLVRHAAKMLETLTESVFSPSILANKGRNDVGSGNSIRLRRRFSFLQRHQQQNLTTSTSGLSFLGGQHKGSTASGSFTNRSSSGIHPHAPPTVPFDLEVYVNVEATDHVESATALELAVKHRCNPDIVRTLLYEGGASVSRPSGLPTGGSLLHLAVAQTNPTYVQLMLDCYADPDELDDDQCTPLFRALLSLKNANLERTRSILSQSIVGTLPTRKDNGTVESSARFESVVEIISLLLKYGAQPGLQSFVTLQTQYHIAAQLGLPPRVFNLLFLDFDENSGCRANGVGLHPSPDSQAHRSGVFSKESGHLTSELVPSPFSGESCVRVGDAAFSSDTGSTRQHPRHARHYHEEKSHDADDVFFSPTITTHPSNTRKLDDCSSPTHHAAIHTASAMITPPVGRLTKNFDPPHTGLAVNEALMITDAYLRTPLFYLCGQTDRSSQLCVLPTLLRILSLSSPCISSKLVGKKDTMNVAIDRVFNKEFSQSMCRMADSEGRLPLHVACQAHFVEAVHALLEVDPDSVFVIDSHGNSPLHDCVSGNCYSHLDRTIMCFPHNANGESKQCENPEGTYQVQVAIDEMVQAIARVVRSSLPHTLKGFPTPFLPKASDLFSAKNLGSCSYRNKACITSQIEEFLAQSPFFFDCSPHHAQSKSYFQSSDIIKGTDLRHCESDATLIPDWEAYMNLRDEQGRTALLLAGERGDAAAARALLRATLRK